ncbi:MAG: proteasome accessory factor PafA2 family protein [Bifidobacterium sp.]
MGTETEYAVSALGTGALQSGASYRSMWSVPRRTNKPSIFAGTIGRRIRSTTPAAPGWNVHPRILICLTDAPQLNITNVIAVNGGRVYVDHAHPEYSVARNR